GGVVPREYIPVTDKGLQDSMKTGILAGYQMVDVKATFCFERCDRGPVVRVNEKIIEHATFDKVKEVIDKEISRIGKSINEQMK
ncbi:MAG: hypothetical protein EOM76_06580, partial [Sphingobacteriia bacterium]|nr:hypothetical protein [Sphingobacteriia bacterium]